MKVQAIALNTFREAIRNYVIYTVIAFAALLVGISAFFGAVTIGDQARVIKDFGLFAISFFGALMSMISGVSLLNKELKQKTVFNILSKPVERWEFILGKYLGLCLTVWLLIALMGLGLVLFLFFFEWRMDWLLFEGIFFTMLESAIVAAVTVFFSSIVITTTLAALFTFATYIAGRSIHYLGYFLDTSQNFSPGLRTVVHCFDVILPDLSYYTVSASITYGDPIPVIYLTHAILYAAAYSTLAITFASAVFHFRELN